MKYNKHLFEAYVERFSDEEKKIMFIDMLGLVPEDLAKRITIKFYHSEEEREKDVTYNKNEVEELITKALTDCKSWDQHVMNACGIDEYALPHFEKMVSEWMNKNL